MTTGGSTSGRWIKASSADLPQKSRRANSHASAIPIGVATRVATVATRSDSRIAVHSVGDMSNTSGRRADQEREAVFFEHGLRRRRAQESEIVRGFAASRLSVAATG